MWSDKIKLQCIFPYYSSDSDHIYAEIMVKSVHCIYMKNLTHSQIRHTNHINCVIFLFDTVDQSFHFQTLIISNSEIIPFHRIQGSYYLLLEVEKKGSLILSVLYDLLINLATKPELWSAGCIFNYNKRFGYLQQQRNTKELNQLCFVCLLSADLHCTECLNRFE